MLQTWVGWGASCVHDAGGAARLPCSLLICKAFPTERRLHSQMKAALYFLLHLTLAFGGLAYLFFQSLRHLENLAYLSFQKKKNECHSLTPHPNPPFLEARKAGLASASPASPASVPSLVLRATGHGDLQLWTRMGR